MTSVDAELLVQRLQDLHAGGVVNEAVIHGALGAWGASWDKSVLVAIPEIDDAVPLAEDIGILDVKQFLREVEALTPSQGSGTIRLEVESEDRSLLLYAPGIGESRLPVAAARDVEPYPELREPVAELLTREPAREVYLSSDMITKLLSDVERIGPDEVMIEWDASGTYAVVLDASGNLTSRTVLDEEGWTEAGDLVLPPEFIPLLKRAEKMDRLDILGPRGPVILRKRDRANVILAALEEPDF